jgi:hypothetical protein
MAPPTDPDEPASTSNGSKSLFEAFPREIRDIIYGFAIDQHDLTHSSSYYHIRFQAACPRLRLISRKFKREYDEHHERSSNLSLVVTDISPRFLTRRTFQGNLTLPRLATRCTALHFTLTLQDPDVFVGFRLSSCLESRRQRFVPKFG